jgi:hypothetical protein
VGEDAFGRRDMAYGVGEKVKSAIALLASGRV